MNVDAAPGTTPITVSDALSRGWIISLVCTVNMHRKEDWERGHGFTYTPDQLRFLPAKLSLAALAKGSLCPKCGAPLVSMEMQGTPVGNGSFRRGE